MIRRRQVYPDATGVVTREALLEAMIDAATFLDFAGGVLSVVTQRQSTGLPGEMVTVGAIVEWRHDARVEPKPQQFEQAARAESYSSQPHLDEQARKMAAEVEAERNAALLEHDPETAALAGITSVGVDPADGFDYSKLDEEDVEPAPAELLA